MLYLLFDIDNKTYSMDVKDIVEIVPLVNLDKIPNTHEAIAGIFNYRGQITPVIDLSMLICSRPCQKFISTRIIVINFFAADKTYHKIGLMAERVIETIDCEESNSRKLNFNLQNADYMDNVLLKKDNMIQNLDSEKLISNEIQNIIFKS